MRGSRSGSLGHPVHAVILVPRRTDATPCDARTRDARGRSVVARSVIDHSVHTPYSDPVRHAGLLAELSTDPAALSRVARNVIAHHRAAGHLLPVDTRPDIDIPIIFDKVVQE